MLNGKINSALRFLSKEDSAGVLSKGKHLKGQEPELGSFVFGPIEDVPYVLYRQINGDMLREAALKSKGSLGS